MNPAKTFTAITDWLIVILFLGFAFIPLLLAVAQPDKVISDIEKRPLAEFPGARVGAGAIVEFARGFDAYYQDHFGLREFFIHRYHREMKKRFNDSGASEVVPGTDGWLYYTGEGALDDLRGRLRLTDAQLDLLTEKLESKKEWLAGMGIRYLAIVSPNKQTIYPEFLPDFYQQQRGETRFDQVTQRVNSGGKNMLIDIRPALLAQKDQRLYDKTDTHWNYLGAYHGYRDVMKYIEELFPTHDFAAYFNVGSTWQVEGAGDLAILSGRDDTLGETRPVIFAWLRAREQELNGPVQALLALEKLQPYYTVREERKLKALVLHDSFMNPMKVFISESFAEVLYIWKYYDDETMSTVNREVLEKIIDEFQPDIVMDEIVERHLDWLLVGENPEKGGAAN